MLNFEYHNPTRIVFGSDQWSRVPELLKEHNAKNVLFAFGGGSIKGFSFALLIGVIVGTYSSIFIATPILSDLTKELSGKSKEKEDKVKFSKAAAKAR